MNIANISMMVNEGVNMSYKAITNQVLTMLGSFFELSISIATPNGNL